MSSQSPFNRPRIIAVFAFHVAAGFIGVVLITVSVFCFEAASGARQRTRTFSSEAAAVGSGEVTAAGPEAGFVEYVFEAGGEQWRGHGWSDLGFGLAGGDLILVRYLEYDPSVSIVETDLEAALENAVAWEGFFRFSLLLGAVVLMLAFAFARHLRRVTVGVFRGRRPHGNDLRRLATHLIGPCLAAPTACILLVGALLETSSYLDHGDKLYAALLAEAILLLLLRPPYTPLPDREDDETRGPANRMELPGHETIGFQAGMGRIIRLLIGTGLLIAGGTALLIGGLALFRLVAAEHQGPHLYAYPALGIPLLLAAMVLLFGKGRVILDAREGTLVLWWSALFPAGARSYPLEGFNELTVSGPTRSRLRPLPHYHLLLAGGHEKEEITILSAARLESVRARAEQVARFLFFEEDVEASANGRSRWITPKEAQTDWMVDGFGTAAVAEDTAEVEAPADNED